MANMETNRHGYVLIKLYLHKQVVGWFWPMGPRLLTSELDKLYGTFHL